MHFNLQLQQNRLCIHVYGTSATLHITINSVLKREKLGESAFIVHIAYYSFQHSSYIHRSCLKGWPLRQYYSTTQLWNVARKGICNQHCITWTHPTTEWVSWSMPTKEPAIRRECTTNVYKTHADKAAVICQQCNKSTQRAIYISWTGR